MALILVFVNKSDLAPISDYTVEVLVGDGTPARSRTIARSEVKGHRRSDGWQVLVNRFMEGQPIAEYKPDFTEYKPDFCRACGASIPPREGEGTCEICMRRDENGTPTV